MSVKYYFYFYKTEAKMKKNVIFNFHECLVFVLRVLSIKHYNFIFLNMNKAEIKKCVDCFKSYLFRVKCYFTCVQTC